MDLRGRIVAQDRRPHQGTDPAQVLGGLAARLPRLIAAHGAGRTVLALGVATGQWVDPATGVIVDHPRLGWRDVPARELLGAATGLPVHVDSHSRALARAEQLFGAVATRDSAVVLFVGAVVDAAFATGGTVHRGPRSGAGSVAHLPVGPDDAGGPRGRTLFVRHARLSPGGGVRTHPDGAGRGPRPAGARLPRPARPGAGRPPGGRGALPAQSPAGRPGRRPPAGHVRPRGARGRRAGHRAAAGVPGRTAGRGRASAPGSATTPNGPSWPAASPVPCSRWRARRSPSARSTPTRSGPGRRCPRPPDRRVGTAPDRPSARSRGPPPGNGARQRRTPSDPTARTDLIQDVGLLTRARTELENGFMTSRQRDSQAVPTPARALGDFRNPARPVSESAARFCRRRPGRLCCACRTGRRCQGTR